MFAYTSKYDGLTYCEKSIPSDSFSESNVFGLKQIKTSSSKSMLSLNSIVSISDEKEVII